LDIEFFKVIRTLIKNLVVYKYLTNNFLCKQRQRFPHGNNQALIFKIFAKKTEC